MTVSHKNQRINYVCTIAFSVDRDLFTARDFAPTCNNRLQLLYTKLMDRVRITNSFQPFHWFFIELIAGSHIIGPMKHCTFGNTLKAIIKIMRRDSDELPLTSRTWWKYWDFLEIVDETNFDKIYGIFIG